MDVGINVYNQKLSGGRKGPQAWTFVETVNTAAALLLILSPWMFRYSDASTPTWTATLIGLLLGVATLTRAIETWVWQKWASLALGVCAFLAPWLLGFGDIRNAAGMHVTAGVVVVVSTLIELWVHYLDPSI